MPQGVRQAGARPSDRAAPRPRAAEEQRAEGLSSLAGIWATGVAALCSGHLAGVTSVGRVRWGVTQGGGGATALLTLSGAGFIHKLSGSAPAIPPQEGETPRSSLSPLPPAKAPESWDIPYRSVGAEEPTRTPAPATRVFTGWAPPTERDLALIIPNEGRKLRPCTHPPPPGLPRVRPLLPRSRFPLTLQGDGGSWEGLPLCPSLSSWTELFISEQGCGRLCVACSALVPAPLCSSWNKGAPAPASPGGEGVGFGHRPQAAGRRVFLGEARPSGALTWGALEVRGTHCLWPGLALASDQVP